MPPFSDDDVLDFIVADAVRAKVNEMRKEEQKDQEGAAFRGSHQELAKMAGGGMAR